jgi:hypothetical protein
MPDRAAREKAYREFVADLRSIRAQVKGIRNSRIKA